MNGGTVEETLKEFIAVSGQKVGTIARRARIPQPVLWRFMNGSRTLTLPTAEKLMNYFKLELVRVDPARTSD
jgi:hypothetical protein